MARARWTSHPSVVATCPVCGHDLPPIVVDVDGRSDGPGTLTLSLEVQELDAAWWGAARETHPDCVPPDAGRYGVTVAP